MINLMTMKSTSLLTVICLSLALPGLAAAKTPAESTTKPAENPAAPKTEAQTGTKAKKGTYPLYGEVVAVTSNLLTIKGGQGKEDRKYAITPETLITKDGKPATTADVKPGQWVGGLLQKNLDGSSKVLKLNLSVKQKEAKPAAKQGGKAKAEAGSAKK
jgi:hypothetical protein